MDAIMSAWRGIAVAAALSGVALIIAVVMAGLAVADTPAALGSDSGWTCHRLAFVEICDHTAQGKSPSNAAAGYASPK
jgi:hypothetical protein